MTKNIGRFDQVLRIGISLGLIYVGFVSKQFIHNDLSSNIIGIIGALNLIVALVQFCPMYVVTGINTYSQESK